MGEAIKVKEKIYLGQHLRKFGAVYAFIILVIVDSMLNKNFLALNTLWNLSIQVLPILLTALGMLLVISTSGIDISTGSLMAVAGVLCAKFITGQITLGGGSILLAMLAGLLAATLLGALNGALIAQFKIQPIIVTLVLYIAGRGVAQLMSNGTTLVFYNTPFNDLGVMRLFGQMPLQLLLEIIFVAAEAIANGEMACTVVCSPFFGETVLSVINTLENGGTVESYIQNPGKLIDAANIQEYLPEAY